MAPRRGNSKNTATKDEGRESDSLSTIKEEVTNLARNVENKLTLLEEVIKEVREGQAGIVRSLTFLDEKYEEMKRVTEKLEKENNELKKNNASMQRQIDDLGRQVTDLDQYHRRVNLEIVGVPERKDEDPEKIVLEIAKKISPAITAKDIDIVHRLGSSKEGKHRRPRPIIVKFANRRAGHGMQSMTGGGILGTWRSVTSASKDKKTGSTSTKTWSDQQESFLELSTEPDIKRVTGSSGVWTYNGKIFVRKDEKALAIGIHGKEDISKIK